MDPDRLNIAHKGFTLIELSIVLVIIGLIVGGILVGRDLIHAAEVRSVITQVEHYKTAVNTFRIKYNCLPGDCANATDFFGVAASGCGTAGYTGTCNGNGDGIIVWSTESYRFWQQLALAELIPGKYNGAYGTSIAYMRTNGVPASRMANLYFEVFSENFAYWTNANIDTVSYIRLGGLLDAPPVYVSDPAVKIPDGYLIDLKMDDGLPGKGKVRTHTIGNCVDGGNANDAHYYISYTAGNCLMQFIF